MARRVNASASLLVAALALLQAASAVALGLGELRLNSFLNEPLDAEVALLDGEFGDRTPRGQVPEFDPDGGTERVRGDAIAHRVGDPRHWRHTPARVEAVGARLLALPPLHLHLSMRGPVSVDSYACPRKRAA